MEYSYKEYVNIAFDLYRSKYSGAEVNYSLVGYGCSSEVAARICKIVELRLGYSHLGRKK